SRSRGFRRDQACADLFPEHDDAARRFSVAIYDLRSFLKQELGVTGDPFIVSDGHQSIRLDLSTLGRRVTIDADALTSLSADLRVRRSGALPPLVPAFFSGEFLEGVDAEWALAARRYWTTLYLRTLGVLAELYARDGRLQDAVRCHELALEIDPTLE